ncbi:complement factor H-like isoform X3 [Scomber scombrus]|uniref:complement factor H-like isoform X3 n=1 Tax=Scomber scombrus TaxID=13677 RepID=UPI002DD909C3|nr:complement factor H-like isoform X3 [Scomber scombrus]
MHVITQICVLFLWMHTVTFVTSIDCTLEQFINSGLYDSNFDTTNLESSYIGGKQVRVGCNVGFSGFFKLICTDDGWKRSVGGVCKARSCGHPGDAQFADFHLEIGEDFVFGSKVMYTCHKGYQMVSRINFRTCLAQGWDGAVPVCEAQQCPVIRVENNVQVIGDPEEANYGNVIRFSCKLRNQILEGPAEIYCDENGQWSATAPTCKEVTCAPPKIEDGYVREEKPVYQEHEVLDFACNHEYRRSDGIPSKCTKLGTTAVWSPTPLCEPIKCKVDRLEGTRFDPPYKNLFSPGETVRVICDKKYWVSTPQEVSATPTCLNDGEWTFRPICQEVTCSNQKQPNMDSWQSSRWWSTPTLGDTRTFSCRYGYKRAGGDRSVTCTRDGWKPDPACQEITCDREDVPNTDIDGDNKQKYKLNEHVRYVCKDGYEGSFTRTCGENGWNKGWSERCTEIKCQVKLFQHTDIDRSTSEYKSEYKYNERVDYVCKNDYEGSFTLTCGKAGWIGNQQCTRKQCEKLDINNADLIQNEKQSYNQGDRVQYACRNDSNRRFIITCEQGVWTGVQKCEACSKPDVAHGFAVEINGTLYYSCNAGYKLSSKGWWGEATCNDGKWSNLEQCIANNRCGEVPMIPNMEVTPVRGRHQIITVTCKEGYRAQITRLTCRGGKWDTNGKLHREICKPIQSLCKPPLKIENTVVTTSYQKEYLSGNSVTYRCRNRYTIEGDDTITCEDGQWEKKDIACTLYCNTEAKQWRVIDNKDKHMNGSVIKYSCTTGEEDEGTATCIDGKWIETVQCEALSCAPPPADEWITMKGLPDNEDHILPDRFLTFSCDAPGKYLNGSSKLICGTDGQWDKPLPTCEDIACKVDELHSHLHVVDLPENKTIKLGNKIRFFCDDQYGLDGPQEIQCSGHEKWSGTFPTCSEKCRITDVHRNTRLERHEVGQQLGKGDKLRFYCPLRGHHLRGNEEVECLANGQWSHPFPTCGEPLGCGRPSFIEDADTTTSYKSVYDHGERVEYRCQNYYVMKDGPYKTCFNGEWIGEMRCLKGCRITYVHRNTRLERHEVGQQLGKGDKLRFYCPIRGHYLRGNAEVECLANGQWSHPFSTCGEPLGCGRPPFIEDADTTTSSKRGYDHEERVEYRCQNYYIMKDGPYKTCFNGEWIGEMRCLKPCTVDSALMNSHNIDFLYIDRNKLYSVHDDSMSFKCKGGTRHDGRVGMRPRCNDGVMQLPTCH